MNAFQCGRIPRIAYVSSGFVNFGNWSWVLGSEMPECQNHLVGLDTPSIRQVDLVSVVARLLTNGDRFAMYFLKQYFAVTFSFLPQDEFQIVAIESPRNKSAGVESQIYVLAKLDEMIGVVCQRAHIASGHIQQEIIVPCTVSEATAWPGTVSYTHLTLPTN